jgi:hypothetical protein
LVRASNTSAMRNRRSRPLSAEAATVSSKRLRARRLSHGCPVEFG